MTVTRIRKQNHETKYLLHQKTKTRTKTAAIKTSRISDTGIFRLNLMKVLNLALDHVFGKCIIRENIFSLYITENATSPTRAIRNTPHCTHGHTHI